MGAAGDPVPSQPLPARKSRGAAAAKADQQVIRLPAPAAHAPPNHDAELADRLFRYDVIFAGLVMALALLLPSYPARNSDVWLHLAAGNRLLEGTYVLGTDPFAATEQPWVNHSWLYDLVSARLYETFGGHAGHGGAVLLGVKAAAVVLLALLLLQAGGPSRRLWYLPLAPAVAAMLFLDLFHTAKLVPAINLLRLALVAVFFAAASVLWRNAARRWAAAGVAVLLAAAVGWLFADLGISGVVLAVEVCLILFLLQLWLLHAPRETGYWWPAAATALALVTLAPWLALRPLCLSLLFLALTWQMLERGKRLLAEASATDATAVKSAVRAYWPLPVLFAVWANVDEWFFLGPLTAALVLASELLRAAGSREGFRFAAPLALATAAGLGACAINPHHVGVFRPPPELTFTAAAAPWPGDPFLARIAPPAPWRSDFLFGRGGPRPAAVAYWVMAGGLVLSFLLHRSQTSWPRLVVAGAFLFASLAHGSFIPFFAVAAAPILSANFIALAGRFGSLAALKGGARTAALAARPLGVVIAFALLVLTWPGWLQGGMRGPRYWAVEADAYLKLAAEQVRDWRAGGKIGNRRLLNASPELAHYLAYFAPREKNLLDARLNADAKAARAFLDVRRALFGPLASPAEAEREFLTSLRRAMTEQGCSVLLVHAGDLEGLRNALFRMHLFPGEWPLLYLNGRTLAFGWRPSGKAPSRADDFSRLHVSLGDLSAPPAATPAARGPEPFAPPHRWWEDFYQAMPPPSEKVDEAHVYLLLFDALAPDYRTRNADFWLLTQVASQVGDLAIGAAPGGWVSPALTAELRVHLSRLGPSAFVLHYDDGPPALLYRAVGAARQAVRDNPQDARAYHLLGQSYFQLNFQTRERVWARAHPPLARLRTIQAIAALKHATRLDSERGDSHRLLAQIYRSMGYRDLALQHQKEFLNWQRRLGPVGGETSTEFERRLFLIRDETETLEKEVADQLAKYEHESGQMLVLSRARHAQALGLGAKALDVLLQSEVGVFGPEGARLELDLLLATGRPKEVRDWVKDDFIAVLGATEFHWLRVQAAAALGDYATADEHLRQITLQHSAIPRIDERRRAVSNSAAAITAWDLGSKLMTPTENLGQLAAAIQMTRELTSAAKQKELSAAESLFLPVLLRLLDVRVSDQADGSRATQDILKLTGLLAGDADITVLRGLLALEANQPRGAASHFRDALTLWSADDHPAARLDFSLRPAAQACLELLEPQRPSP